MERQPYPPPGSCVETVQGGGYGVKETTVVDGKQIIITICVNLLRFGKCCVLRPYTFLANADDQKQLVRTTNRRSLCSGIIGKRRTKWLGPNVCIENIVKQLDAKSHDLVGQLWGREARSILDLYIYWTTAISLS